MCLNVFRLIYNDTQKLVEKQSRHLLGCMVTKLYTDETTSRVLTFSCSHYNKETYTCWKLGVKEKKGARTLRTRRRYDLSFVYTGVLKSVSILYTQPPLLLCVSASLVYLHRFKLHLTKRSCEDRFRFVTTFFYFCCLNVNTRVLVGVIVQPLQ